MLGWSWVEAGGGRGCWGEMFLVGLVVVRWVEGVVGVVGLVRVV